MLTRRDLVNVTYLSPKKEYMNLSFNLTRSKSARLNPRMFGGITNLIRAHFEELCSGASIVTGSTKQYLSPIFFSLTNLIR
jgi:hypothetical protein